MNRNDYDKIIDKAKDIQKEWRTIPAPRRGDLIRVFGNELRADIETIGTAIMKDAKKIHAEAIGEVQEAIDMCDFAVGLSRQLYGLTIQSERPEHKLQEVYNPLGVVGVITAFNFPCAVWAWNHCLAMVCAEIVWYGKVHPKQRMLQTVVSRLGIEQ